MDATDLARLLYDQGKRLAGVDDEHDPFDELDDEYRKNVTAHAQEILDQWPTESDQLVSAKARIGELRQSREALQLLVSAAAQLLGDEWQKNMAPGVREHEAYRRDWEERRHRWLQQKDDAGV